MSWFRTLLIFLCFTFSGDYCNLSEAKKHQKKKLSPAAVVGTVYCDTCFGQDLPKAGHSIQGAWVELECKGTSLAQSFHKQVETDKNGRFKVDLPFSVSKHVKKIKNCSIKLIKSNQPFCSIAAAAESSSLNLKSRKKGVHIFSAGFFSFKPSNQPDLCNQKQSTNKKKSPNFLFEKEFSPIANVPTFLPPVQGYNNLPDLGRYLPPLPKLPPLPQLPSLPGISFMPPKAADKDEKLLTNRPMLFPFPPNPFNPLPNPLQPPPSIVPPIIPSPPPSIIPPIFPSPPTSIIPPVFPSPSPPPSVIPPFLPTPPFNLPPVPGLLPSPPPPPPPAFPIPLPPLPLVPVPGFPGVPPANKEHSDPKTKSVAP